MKTYSEKLKDPRWQKKRLEILERDKFSCQTCKDDKTELHIHHKKYGHENPWDNENEDLITCCKHCHKLLSDLQTDNINISEIIRKNEFYIVLGYNSNNEKLSTLYAIHEQSLVHIVSFRKNSNKLLIDLLIESYSFFNK